MRLRFKCPNCGVREMKIAIDLEGKLINVPITASRYGVWVTCDKCNKSSYPEYLGVYQVK